MKINGNSFCSCGENDWNIDLESLKGTEFANDLTNNIQIGFRLYNGKGGYLLEEAICFTCVVVCSKCGNKNLANLPEKMFPYEEYWKYYNL